MKWLLALLGFGIILFIVLLVVSSILYLFDANSIDIVCKWIGWNIFYLIIILGVILSLPNKLWNKK